MSVRGVASLGFPSVRITRGPSWCTDGRSDYYHGNSISNEGSAGACDSTRDPALPLRGTRKLTDPHVRCTYTELVTGAMRGHAQRLARAHAAAPRANADRNAAIPRTDADSNATTSRRRVTKRHSVLVTTISSGCAPTHATLKPSQTRPPTRVHTRVLDALPASVIGHRKTLHFPFETYSLGKLGHWFDNLVLLLALLRHALEPVRY